MQSADFPESCILRGVYVISAYSVIQAFDLLAVFLKLFLLIFDLRNEFAIDPCQLLLRLVVVHCSHVAELFCVSVSHGGFFGKLFILASESFVLRSEGFF